MLDVRERPAYGPREYIAPWARACLVVDPSPLTVSWAGLFETGWKPNCGRADSYGLHVGGTLFYVSLEEGVWMVEAIKGLLPEIQFEGESPSQEDEIRRFLLTLGVR